MGVDSHTDISGESVTGTKNSECKSPKLIKCLRPIPERAKRWIRHRLREEKNSKSESMRNQVVDHWKD